MKRTMHPLARIPAWESLDTELRSRFSEASQCLSCIRRIDPEAWRETVGMLYLERQRFTEDFELERRKLEDEVLPLYIEHRGEPSEFTSRTSLESETLSIYFPLLRSALEDGDFESFQHALQAAAAAMNPESGIFRNGSIFLNADQHGDYWEFPDPSAIQPTMRQVFSLMKEDADPTYLGAMCYLLLVHTHPFRDGNGRTSRLLCNFIWRHRTGSPHYVPLKEIFALGRGSFGIALTRVRAYDEWTEFFRFFHVGVKLIHDFPDGQAFRRSSFDDRPRAAVKDMPATD